MNKKYELTDECIEFGGRKLYRIRALIDFSNVKVRDLGGYVESYANLSQEGTCWIYNDAKVYDGSIVLDRAVVFGDAKVCDCSKVYGDASVYDNAIVRGFARVCGDASIYDYAVVCGHAKVCNCAIVSGNAVVSGKAEICGFVDVNGDADVCLNAIVTDNLDYATVSGFGIEQRTTTFFRLADGDVGVSSGCFAGTIDEFRTRVKETRNGKIAEEYLAIADLMESHFRKEE